MTIKTIAQLQADTNYRYPREREGCQNCLHVRFVREGEAGPYERARWDCTRHGFRTAALAICGTYVPEAV